MLEDVFEGARDGLLEGAVTLALRSF